MKLYFSKWQEKVKKKTILLGKLGRSWKRSVKYLSCIWRAKCSSNSNPAHLLRSSSAWPIVQTPPSQPRTKQFWGPILLALSNCTMLIFSCSCLNFLLSDPDNLGKKGIHSNFHFSSFSLFPLMKLIPRHR